MKEEKKGLAGFFEKWGAFIAIGLVVIALVFLLTSPVVTFDTKFKPEGAEKAIKNYYSATFIGLFDAKVTPAWPAITIASLLGLGVIANLVSYFWKKYHDAVSVGATFAYILAVAMIFIEKDLFANFGAELIEHFHGADIGWGAAVAMAFIVLAAIVSFPGAGYSKDANARAIAEDGILIAAALVLDFIKIPLQVEGSINFQMLPLMIIALRRGPVHGFIAGGIVYGLISCLKDGYGFFYFPFDYLIGFGSVFAMGYFRKLILPEGETSYNIKSILWIVVAGAITSFIRFVGGCISSMVFYSYTISMAAGYNAGYIFISGGLAIAVLAALQGPLARVNTMFPVERAKIGAQAE